MSSWLKVKVNLSLSLTKHAFFNLGTRWRWAVSFTPRPLYPPGKDPPVRIG